MKVWLLYEDHGYDGTEVLAIYATEAEARRCCDALPDAVAERTRVEAEFESRNRFPTKDATPEERSAYTMARRDFCAPATAAIADLIGEAYPWSHADGWTVKCWEVRP